MKLGAENKKAAYILAALFVVLGYLFYSNVLSGPSSSDASSTARVAAPAPSDDSADAAQTARAQIAAHARDEFLPSVHKRGSKPPDPNTVDPTIHTELLAKLNDVPAAGGGRDLFSFGKPAPVLDKGPEPNVQPKWIAIGPRVTPPPVTPGPPPVAPPPPIPLKYYGIVTTLVNGKKTAFFMDGDEILLETEGVTFKGRYRLVRIGVNNAVVEDIQYKHQQTLPLAEDAQG
jgi:hypothetical protein